MAKPYAKKFYSSKRWLQCRDFILKRDYYTCQLCGKPDCNTVHHKRPITPGNINNPAITLNPDNLITICFDCHSAIHDRFQRSKYEPQERNCIFDSQGNIIGVTTKDR